MGRVVHKYGGSSVADADCIKRVAQRIVATKKAGNDVVVVISAMGDTTDELMDLAQQVSRYRRRASWTCCSPRVSGSPPPCWRWRSRTWATRSWPARRGVTTSAHGNARIIDITPGRIEALGEGHVAIVAGFQGVAQDTKDITTMGRGASDTTAVAGRGAGGGLLRDLHRRGRHLHRGPADRRPRRSRRSPTRRCSRWPPAAPRCCTCAASSTRRYNVPVHVLLLLAEGRHLGRRCEGTESDGTGDHLRRGPRPQRGQDHVSSACRTSPVRRPGSSRRSPAPRPTST